MIPHERRYPKEEFARRGTAIYENDVRPRLTPEDTGKFAAIDIETGTTEIDADHRTACRRLQARVPGAQIWMVRIGSRTVKRFGGRSLRANP
jgi:hypothetical protein